MRHARLWVAVALMLAALQLAACGGGSEPATRIAAATLETVDGTDIPRVILTAEATKRLDVATAPVLGEEVFRRRRYGAEVVSPPASVPEGVAVWVRVVLTERELSSVDLVQPSLVFPLFGDDPASLSGLPAQPAGPSVDTPGDPTGSVYYTFDGASPLAANMSVSLFRRKMREAKALARMRGTDAYLPALPAEDEEFWRQVRALSKRQAQVIALHYLEDRSVADIAGILECAENTVKVHLHKGRAKLAERLGLDRGGEA